MPFPTVTMPPANGLTVNSLPNAGQNTMADSLGVAIASNQSAIPITSTSIPVVRSAALESSHVFKASAGVVLDYDCFASSVSGYFMLFDATSAPADGAVTPLKILPVGIGQQSSWDAPPFFPLSFATGLVGVFSTTGPFTKTASVTAFMSARVI